MTGSAFAVSTAVTLTGGPVQLHVSGEAWAPPVLLSPPGDRGSHRKVQTRGWVLYDWRLGAYGPFRMRLDFLPRLGDLDVPTLWLLGQNDDLVGAGEMQAAAAASGGRLETIPDAGHLATLDQPQFFAALAGEFLHDP